MNRIPAALAVLALPVFAAHAAGPEDDGAKSLTTRVAEVTVYADRARVARRASLEAGEETRRFAVRGLPGWIDEGSVRAQLVPPSAGQIIDVEVRSTFLARADAEEVRRAEERVREIADQIGSLDDEKGVLDAQARQIDSIRAFSMEKLPKDALTRDVKVSSYAEMVEFVSESLRKNAKARRDLDRKRRDLVPELAARQRVLGEMQEKASLEQRTVLVTVSATKSAAQLELAYMTPGATWEPVTEMRARPGAASVALASFAVVTQTTGESWDGAAIRMSTQRPGATLRIPELEALLVGGSGPSLARAMGAPEDTFARAVQEYEGKNVLLRKTELNSMVMEQRARQRRVGEVFQSLESRGTTAHFEALGVTTVRTDGRPVRVPLGSNELTAKHRVVAAPEASLNAARIVELVNDSKRPILPGKVALYLDGAFLGTTETDFVAQGESFTLFTGTADAVKLARTLDRKRSNMAKHGKRTRLTVSFLVTAENLGAEAVQVSLRDRLPVSETSEVKVEDVKVLPEVKADRDGKLKWEVALAPRESKTFRVEYALEYPTDLLARMLAPPSPAAASPRNSMDFEDDGLYRQIESLEKSF